MPRYEPLSEAARLELEWKTFGHQMMVDLDCLLEPEFTVRSDDRMSFLMNNITLQMRTKILTDNLPPESVSHNTTVPQYLPTSTWQMWKYRNGGKWYTWKWLDAWLKKWPVVWQIDPERQGRATCTVDLSRFRAYPQAQYRASDFRLGRAVLMHAIGSPIWDIEHLTGYKPKDEGGE